MYPSGEGTARLLKGGITSSWLDRRRADMHVVSPSVWFAFPHHLRRQIHTVARHANERSIYYTDHRRYYLSHGLPGSAVIQVFGKN
jgi:hypothetical protein